MFFDKRLSWDTVSDCASIYFMANCHHYVNSELSTQAPYEREVLEFVKSQASEVVPIVCVERQKKLAARDAALNAWNNAVAASRSNAYGAMRRQFRDGTNAVLRVVVGEQLFDLMYTSFACCARIVKSPISSMTAEEVSLLAATSFALRNKSINAGLVKP